MKDFPRGWSTHGMLFSNQTAHYCKASALFLRAADFLSSGLRSSQVTSNIGLLTRWLMNQPIRREEKFFFFFSFNFTERYFLSWQVCNRPAKLRLHTNWYFQPPQESATLFRWTTTAFHLRCKGGELRNRISESLKPVHIFWQKRMNGLKTAGPLQ